jgi:sugar phosphate isomerase/epimerase
MADETVLTYCTNVHPGETLVDVERSLDHFTVPLRARLVRSGIASAAAFPVGLWFSAATARELADAARRERFAAFLAERGLAAATLNCFPFGGFHAGAVKFEVYRPTWRDPRRLAYTLDAAHALAGLLPEGATAAISTLPLSCKRFGDDEIERRVGAVQLARLAAELARIEAASGRTLVISLEPEPCATLETTGEAVAFFEDHLFAEAGRAAFVAAGGDAAHAEEQLRRHVGVCFDACHQAVEFEEPRVALSRLVRAGIRVGKLQVSSALRLLLPADRVRLGSLARFDEPRYLHQTLLLGHDGSRRAFTELGECLADARALAAAVELRSHFHVPVQLQEIAGLRTTREFLEEALSVAHSTAVTRTFEIETYTYPVLPDGPGQGDALVAAIAAEFEFVASQGIGGGARSRPPGIE